MPVPQITTTTPIRKPVLRKKVFICSSVKNGLACRSSWAYSSGLTFPHARRRRGGRGHCAYVRMEGICLRGEAMGIKGALGTARGIGRGIGARSGVRKKDRNMDRENILDLSTVRRDDKSSM
jgi:hypothetical protein